VDPRLLRALSPYTTLFRSQPGGLRALRLETSTTPRAAAFGIRVVEAQFLATLVPLLRERQAASLRHLTLDFHIPPPRRMGLPLRSEEHTSELQSREKLVCR